MKLFFNDQPKVFKIITSLSPWNRPTSRAPNLPFARPCAGDKWEICLEQSKLVKKDLLTTPRVALRIWQAKKKHRKSYKNLMLGFPKCWQNFGESTTMSTINKTFRGIEVLRLFFRFVASHSSWQANRNLRPLRPQIKTKLEHNLAEAKKGPKDCVVHHANSLLHTNIWFSYESSYPISKYDSFVWFLGYDVMRHQ